MNRISDLSGENAKDAAKRPKTARGERTLAKLLDAAEAEFGEVGFHEASVGSVAKRAGVAAGTFYVYFDSKEAIFEALVEHMGRRTRRFIAERVAGATDRLQAEKAGLAAFLEFCREHADLYRIVMESQFVTPKAYRAYFESFAEGYRRNLKAAAAAGDIRPGDAEERAWALIGLSVFLGLRYVIWEPEAPVDRVVEHAFDFLAHGLAPRDERP